MVNNSELTPSQIRQQILLFANLSNAEVGDIKTVATTQADTVEKVADMMNSKRPDWNAVMQECKHEHGYRLLLAARLVDKTSDELVATAVIFLDHVLKYPNAKIEPTNDFQDVEESQRFVILQDSENPKEVVSFKIHIFKLTRGIEFFNNCHLQPMIGLSDRDEMRTRLKDEKFINDIGFPLPKMSMLIHGNEKVVEEAIFHDLVHALLRARIIKAIGKKAYDVTLDHSKLFDEANKKLPPLTVETTKLSNIPLLKPKATIKDQIFHLLDYTSGYIVDGFKGETYRDLETVERLKNLNGIDESSVRFLLTLGLRSLLNENLYDESRDLTRWKPEDYVIFDYKTLSPNLVEETILALKHLEFIS